MGWKSNETIGWLNSTDLLNEGYENNLHMTPSVKPQGTWETGSSHRNNEVR